MPRVVNICDRKKGKNKLGRMHFSKIMKTIFLAFPKLLNALDLF
jgi:hypothetical protein